MGIIQLSKVNQVEEPEMPVEKTVISFKEEPEVEAAPVTEETPVEEEKVEEPVADEKPKKKGGRPRKK